MSDKKQKKMSPKWFLHLSGTKAANSAIAFLAAHRAFLETGKLAEVTSPILRMMDDKKVLPTPALELIKHAVLTHMLAVETDKMDRKFAEEAAAEDAGFKTRKPWIARVLNAKGEVVETENTVGDVKELQQGFNMASEAERWVDRRLFEGAPDWYGEVSHAVLVSTVIIQRADAIARILKQPKGPTVHKKAQSTQKLSFGVHVKQTRVTFSHG